MKRKPTPDRKCNANSTAAGDDQEYEWNSKVRLLIHLSNYFQSMNKMKTFQRRTDQLFLTWNKPIKQGHKIFAKSDVKTEYRYAFLPNRRMVKVKVYYVVMRLQCSTYVNYPLIVEEQNDMLLAWINILQLQMLWCQHGRPV
jgi:hypothetical protein